MRIPIREQLGALVLLSTLIALAVVSIATWVTNRNFVLGNLSGQLSLTASLKAAQLSSHFLLMHSSVRLVSTRVLIQQALQRYNAGNNTGDNWAQSLLDLRNGALAGGQQAALLLQAVLFPRDRLGPAGSSSLLNVTGGGIDGTIRLPYTYPNGTPVYLGDDNALGYPAQLYPIFTYAASRSTNGPNNGNTASFNGGFLDETSAILLGPWQVNSTFALLSITLPIINNTSVTDILGWLTVVVDGRLIVNVLNSPEGLGNTGTTLLIGPTTVDNIFPAGVLYTDNSTASPQPPGNIRVHFVVQPGVGGSRTSRHSLRAYGQPNAPFTMGDYPAVQRGFTTDQGSINNAGSLVATHNEQGEPVSVGFAVPQTELCDWLLLVGWSRREVWAPIRNLRKILLACVFGTAGGMLLLAFPLAHFSSRPIHRLRAATKASVDPPTYDADDRSVMSYESDQANTRDHEDQVEVARKEGIRGTLARWKTPGKMRRSRDERAQDKQRAAFRIPSKVKDGKHFIHDELTDLTTTFNEMTDELMMQYERLEERVRQRTAELELSKKAAEAANESKTLFIANISHELKTPLNGILGMTAVCMQEEDQTKIKRSLGIIYKSGDLLLNLLTDLLTFSKNQVGQQLSLDEKDFRLRDISSQVRAIFDKQAREGNIDFRISYQGPSMKEDPEGDESTDLGPPGTGRVKDMHLWGDQHRILQVIINLVSNSLKFTPPGGSVDLRIRCLGDFNEEPSSGKGSVQSRRSGESSQHRPAIARDSGSRTRGSSNSIPSAGIRTDTANQINPLVGPKLNKSASISDRPASPPPNARTLLFEFEVQDTGPGIPEHQQQRIFEPFVQGDLGLSKKYGGTGLGLSICSQLAGLMKGSISLKSQQGVGSTFTMRLPLKHIRSRADSNASSVVNLTSQWNSTNGDDQGVLDAVDSRSPVKTATSGPFDTDANPRLVGLSQPFFTTNPPMESPGSQSAAMDRVAAQATQRGDKVRVLVAEDNKVNQEVVLRMLKLEDIYNVELAKDGQEAFDRVKESMTNNKPYDLIFMDVQMPNLDGLASTRLIRQTGYTAPIVALTAFSEESNVKECIDSGMDYFLAKPIRRPALKKVLKTYCPPILEAEEGDPSPKLKGKSRAKEREKKPDNPPDTSTTKSWATENVTQLDDGSPATSPMTT